MRIEYENTGRINFSIMDNGDCFMVDGQLYMRIMAIKHYDGTIKNAVLIESGQLSYFEDWEKVLPVDAKVVVE